MKYGVNTFIWSGDFNQSVVDLLPLIKEHGFDGVEVPLFQPREFAAAAIRKGVEANGLECTVSSVFMGGLSLISEDADVRRKAQVHLQDSAKAVAEAGVKLLVGPLYSPLGYLPGRRRTADQDHGRIFLIRINQAGQGIGEARPGRYQAHPGPPRVHGPGVGHHGRGLLVPDVQKAHPVFHATVINPVDVSAGKRKDRFHAFDFLQAFDH